MEFMETLKNKMTKKYQKIIDTGKVTERNYEHVSHLLAYADSLVRDGYATLKKTKNGKIIYQISKSCLEFSDVEDEVKSQFFTVKKGGLEIIAEKKDWDFYNDITFKGGEEEINRFIEDAGDYVGDLNDSKKNLHPKTRCWSVEEVEEQNILYLFEEMTKEYRRTYVE